MKGRPKDTLEIASCPRARGRAGCSPGFQLGPSGGGVGAKLIDALQVWRADRAAHIAPIDDVRPVEGGDFIDGRARGDATAVAEKTDAATARVGLHIQSLAERGLINSTEGANPESGVGDVRMGSGGHKIQIRY